jgi:hypothetical protein
MGTECADKIEYQQMMKIECRIVAKSLLINEAGSRLQIGGG